MNNNHYDRTYVESLTGLRGVAALFVFIFHYGSLNPGIRLDLTVPIIGTALQFPLGFGFAGVDLFFVLSGFLLTLPFARAALTGKKHPPLGRYYKRRLLRVFPAYYTQLFIILIIGGWFVTWKSLDGVSLLAHLTMFFNMGWNQVRPMVGLWWTLPVELLFYLMLPAVALFLRPRRWVFFLSAGIVLSILYRYWSSAQLGTVTPAGVFLLASQIPGSLPEFLLGATAALIVQWSDVNTNGKPPAWLLEVMFLLGAVLTVMWLWGVLLPNVSAYWRGHWSMLVAPSVLGLPLSLMVISLYWGSRIGRVLFANPVIYYLGLVSYSLYLWHFVVLQQIPVVLGEADANLTGLSRFMVSSILVVLVSSVSYFLFERPFFRLKNKPR